MTPDALAQTAERARQRNAEAPHTARVCVSAGCQPAGALEVRSALEKAAGGRCRVVGVGCLGLCSAGPLVRVDPEGHLYGGVAPSQAEAIVGALGSGPVEALWLDPNHPFFALQRRVVLERCGLIDPMELEDALAAGAYADLVKTLTTKSPVEVIEEVVRSRLRGRGGAGYPTGLKWRTVAKAPGPEKYVICNADEGDPGAFMDRSVLEGDPHRVLEGMAIAGYAVGAQRGFIYVRVEYPLAVARLERAIQQARAAGLLGPRVLGTSFSFDIELRLGAGAFVCGEETALMRSIEGKRGTTVSRPPYPAQSGLWGRPTLINNVETFANIPSILRHGGDGFAAIGTPKSGGTKVFALAGQIRHVGLVEVPMGTPLRVIIEEMGGGPPDDRTLKAVQTGGSSGGCIPAEHLDTPVDYETLSALGSIMGSGGMIAIDDTTSMVEVARFFMEFSSTESCGRCIPCRVGTVHLRRLLETILASRGTPETLRQIEELSEMVKDTSACGLGQAAPNPVLSTLRFFRGEYESLLQKAHA